MADAPQSFIDYAYTHAQPTWADHEVWGALRAELAVLPAGTRIFELGCGNGSMAARVAALGFAVTAVDPSPSGIDAARGAHAGVRFEVGSAEQPLGAVHGRFPAVFSIEVVEHCYSPRRFAAAIDELLEPGGYAFVSTPYHGYFKNLALALSGRLDLHFGALWEGGHIKFFSIKTLSELFTQRGFRVLRVARVGRVAPFAKSMILVAQKP